jgi:hypothetical protein
MNLRLKSDHVTTSSRNTGTLQHHVAARESLYATFIGGKNARTLSWLVVNKDHRSADVFECSSRGTTFNADTKDSDRAAG